MLFAAFGLSLAAASPSFAYDQNLGGVNLTAWCVGAYGAAFHSVALGPGAGDWVCQRGTDIHDRRPISVQSACQQQYPQYVNFVKARSGTGAGSWVCLVHYNEAPVNMTTWCMRHFGSTFHAQLIGNTTGSWVCQRGLDVNDRRPISVLQACQEQHTGVYKALPVPPVNWVCLLGPVKV